jgi:hypothetical protein
MKKPNRIAARSIHFPLFVPEETIVNPTIPDKDDKKPTGSVPIQL